MKKLQNIHRLPQDGWHQLVECVPQEGERPDHVPDDEVATIQYDGGHELDLNDLLPPDSEWTLNEVTGIYDDRILGIGRLAGEAMYFVIRAKNAEW